MALMIVMIVVLAGMMFWQSRSAKKQQAQVQDFRESLEPGTEVITIGGVIGKVVSVDTKYEEIVIDSEGSKLRFSLKSVNKQYVRPAFVDDDEVDENGNPLQSDQSSDESTDDESTDQKALAGGSHQNHAEAKESSQQEPLQDETANHMSSDVSDISQTETDLTDTDTNIKPNSTKD
ncbi:preprotein translocase subunit YajC [Bifidobacterium aemilianum]|uniref:Preprotein translocase subunit YajC n=1 Tax=Bifidobacterium aemilianum TaxID=2493120 RepID=A0A366K8K6_9BIFI|nr:preprotein translocase subunit YajC [Bifidobacterium aemilianum]RBP98065.1 preprotein translocase subunit YajC [Bifidobacterium aemilianum]